MGKIRTKTDPRIARERRARALGRAEIRGDTSPRDFATGVTSPAMKRPDPATEAAIRLFLEARGRT